MQKKIDLKNTKDKVTETIMETKDNKSYNDEFIKIMEELADIMTRQGEPFKARAYKTAAESIMAYPDPIYKSNQLEKQPGIGKTILEKLVEYEKTGTLRVLERERNNPLNLFTKIYGVGPKKAKQLIESGIDTIDKLKENSDKLNDTQKIGLKYYDDLLKRIPRSEIEEFKEKVKEIFNEVAPEKSKFEIVGSYRRGANSSGDIDIIITNENDDKKVFDLLLDRLIEEKIVIEVLTRGKTKSLTIGKLENYPPCRIDFLYTPPDEYAFAILYFTGSKAFNTVMRLRALKLGYTLNEHGLSEFKSGKKGKKIDFVPKNEEEIFKFLNMKYKEPKDRIDARSVESLNSDEIKEEFNNPPKTPPSEKSPKTPPKPVKKTLKNKVNYKTNIAEFKEKGIDALHLLNEKELSEIIRKASKAYYNEKPILTDNQFDIIKEYIEEKYPDNEAIHEIGAPVEKNKVNLPYTMPSMDKIKPDTKALDNWKEKYAGPYVLSAKLDGISGLYSTEGDSPKLYTRGNGKIGQDISHLIPYLKLPNTENITIRGELIMKKSTFIEKYKEEYANARNMVAGITNKKTIDQKQIQDLDFVAYEVIKPSLKPSSQMEFLEKQENVITVINETKDDISNEILSDYLVDWRENYAYEIDGIIVTDDKIYDREDKNPDYAFAFKMVLSDQVAEVKVLNVIWTPSKDGYLKPRIQIEPIQLGGVKIEYATAFNAAFVEENKIGIGAIVKLVRSGDVIPHIMDVVQPADEAKMPDVPYKWNESHVDIMLENPEEDETVKEKNITGFFKGLEVDGMGPGNVKKLIKAGYDSVAKIIAMETSDFLKVEGFKQKKADKIYKSIHDKIDNASLSELMAVSNVFGRGFGVKKIDPILKAYPDILTSTENPDEKVEKLLKIKGIEKKTAKKFVEHIQPFIDFVEIAKLTDKLDEIENKTPVQIDESNPLYGKNIVITGFRDKPLAEELEKRGVKLATSISKNTFLVIVRDLDDITGKIEKAKEKGIPIVEVNKFKEQYLQ
jgi:NAD-dependent DNA ligase/DNA polymerase/3'-5' exonuclease PolX